MAVHRLIFDPPAAGSWNMAADEALLLDAAENGVATLRFYGWSEPTLSLGYFQAHSDRCQHPASLHCAVVRRQTGGGAILHDHELTYSVALPAGHPLATQTQRLYTLVHDAIIAELSPLISSHSALRMARIDLTMHRKAGAEPFMCFQRRAIGDGVLTAEPLAAHRGDKPPEAKADWKVLGSAQRRHRGAVLQHGSLLWKTSTRAPDLPGLVELTGVAKSLDDVARAWGRRLSGGLQLQPKEQPFPRELKSIAGRIANTKYGVIGWTNRR